jgi:serine phosphatase RsbU (regulator of sigma subunit)
MRRRELEDSLRAAQRYQRTLLFRTRTLQEGWGYDQVSAVTRPHTYIGGDFLIGKRVGEWLYVGIGDATGHGSSGALLAVTVQLLLHQFLLQLSSPEHLHQVLEEVRQELVELWGIHLGEQLSNEGAEVALVALPLSRSKDYLYVATAGRPAYILRRNGEVEEYLQGRRPLGWSAPGQPPETYFTQEIPYPAEATLFLFTDGVTDQLSLNGKRLGRRTFLSWIGETASLTGDPRAQTRHLMQKWHAWKSDIVEQTDDILLLAVAL